MECFGIVAGAGSKSNQSSIVVSVVVWALLEVNSRCALLLEWGKSPDLWRSGGLPWLDTGANAALTAPAEVNTALLLRCGVIRFVGRCRR